jgi:hypothetical protein
LGQLQNIYKLFKHGINSENEGEEEIMDLIDQMKVLSSKLSKEVDMIKTEEATKNAFVMPFLAALGYNVFDPSEVVPEFTADVGVKKGEKVDYAIFKDGEPTILIECKQCGTDLEEKHASQLYRYFSVTKARFGILTNGMIYRFFSDIEEPNKMDNKPFLEINLVDLRETQIEELKRFSKSSFNLDEILTAATELKYTREIKKILAEQIQNPSEEFIKLIATQVYGGRLTATVKQQFNELVKRAFMQFMNEWLNERLKSAMVEEKAPIVFAQPPVVEEVVPEKIGIVTTEQEIEGFHIVKSIVRTVVDLNRVVMRDTLSYCGILLDDNSRKPICRLYFNNPKSLSLVVFVGEERKEAKFPIERVDGIYQYAEQLTAIIAMYENKSKKLEKAE